MKSTMTTVSFSVERDVIEDLDKRAAKERRSRSDIFRDMYRSYQFNKALEDIQAATAPIARKLGIETDDDVFRYISEN